MPTRHRRASFSGVRTERRKLVWTTSVVANNTIANGVVTATDLLAGLEVAGASVLGITVMRIHAQFSTAFAAVGDRITAGIVVGSSADTGNQLDPAVLPDLDWMLNRAVFPNSSGATVNAVEPWEIDLRSKRKMQELNQRLFFAWKPATSGGTTSLSAQFRTLIALP
jgi:hypothetical protein